ncbi:hypothetical protein ElyMa_001550400 [Elysia marginata]|uniref:Uncharacterized protein n=1 Tax=Elysia marginata TaxID=1093978 RepID=A0AAV4JD98_9GAST|nr:hypothetical protein ElyMa_001550400 [Elysia marginata]
MEVSQHFAVTVKSSGRILNRNFISQKDDAEKHKEMIDIILAFQKFIDGRLKAIYFPSLSENFLNLETAKEAELAKRLQISSRFNNTAMEQSSYTTKTA